MKHDRFGAFSEKVAWYLGTPAFLIQMTAFIVIWIVLNTVPGIPHWDPYPFIALTLMLSMQASYAAPFILLADKRQVAREAAKEQQDDKVMAELVEINRKLEDHFNL